MKFDFFAGDLSLDFLNTLDPHAETIAERDSLKAFTHVIEWAAQVGVISASQRSQQILIANQDPQAAEVTFRQTVQFRESLFRLVLAKLEHQEPDPVVLSRFNEVLSAAFSHLQLHTTPSSYDLRLSMEPQLYSLLWPIACAACQLLTSESSQFIRRCSDESCLGFFIDRSKNHSRRWCDMKVCGNRAKARQHYSQKTNRR